MLVRGGNMKIYRKHIVILIVVLIVVFIGMSVYASSKKKKEVDELLAKINREPKGCTEIGNLDNVQADLQFDANHWAYVLYSAKGDCWVCDDNETAVWNVLGGKTLPELRALEDAMKNRYGVSILQHLRSFMNEEEVERAKTIMDNAPA